ncbi:MAG: hypothetical protein QOH81_296 [Sphingomonadales bacterium]|nr:hypothetical protein [Sphingomonadales bacterium]
MPGKSLNVLTPRAFFPTLALPEENLLFYHIASLTLLDCPECGELIVEVLNLVGVAILLVAVPIHQYRPQGFGYGLRDEAVEVCFAPKCMQEVCFLPQH